MTHPFSQVRQRRPISCFFNLFRELYLASDMVSMPDCYTPYVSERVRSMLVMFVNERSFLF